MEANGEFIEIPSDEAELAKASLREAATIMLKPSSNADKLKAAKLILEFTKEKPASKSDVTISTAEDFLNKVLESDDA